MPPPEREYRLTSGIIVKAGTVFRRAADQRGGAAWVECVVPLGRDGAGWLCLPVSVVEVDAAEFFEVGKKNPAGAG